MATLKCALRRKNASGTYDVLALQGASDITYRPSGRTVEQDLNAYLPSVQSSDTVPNTLAKGKILTGNNKAWFGNSANKPVEISNSTHTHDSRYYTEEEINNKLEEFRTVTEFKVGQNVTFGRRHDTGAPIKWIVAHVSNGYGILITRDKYADMVFDMNEPDNPIENRKNYGNNRWSVSNIRQWLNSDKPANGWFVKQHEYDAAPSYANQNGFLFNFTESEKQIIIPKTNLQVVPSLDNDGSHDVTIDSVWLPSMTEYFGWANNNIMEGEQFEWFKTKENRNHSSNIFNSPWMRSTYVGFTDIVHCPLSDGSTYSNYIASARLGVRPGIVIKSVV